MALHASTKVLRVKSSYKLLTRKAALGYEDGAGDTIEENSSVFSLIRMR